MRPDASRRPQPARTTRPAANPPENPVTATNPNTVTRQSNTRKIQSGSFKPWTTADATETRTVRGTNWLSPVDGATSKRHGGGRLDHGEPASVTGAPKATSCVGKQPTDAGISSIRTAAAAISARHAARAPWHLGRARRASFNGKFRQTPAGFSSAEARRDRSPPHGFNYISYGSNRVERFPDDIRGNLLNPGNRKMAYAENLHSLRTFMWDMTANPGYRFRKTAPTTASCWRSSPRSRAMSKTSPARSAPCSPETNTSWATTLDNELPFAAYEERRRRERHSS
ncbi:MAG: hypothetical protein ACLSHL_09950 [Alistipes communis]